MKAPYGPNSIVAERLLDDLDHLHPGAVAALAAAGGGDTGTADDDSDVAARADLRARLRDIAKSGGRLSAIRAIGDEVAAWASSTTHWFPAGVAATGDSTKEIGPRMAAVPIVLDAAYAVVLEDLLSDDELDLLLAPWEEVVGSHLGDRPEGEADGGDDSRTDLSRGDPA
ncbi:MAG: hypothetical protein ABIG85_06870 [Chloroflexota bacterium]